MHISEDCSLFLGLTTLPFGREKDFYEKEIRDGIFKKYKEGCKTNGLDTSNDSKNDFENVFYEPRPYALFGSYDLAILSMVDDFNLGSRSFHPFSPLMEGIIENDKKKYSTSFNYQILSGSAISSTIEENKIIEKAKRTFLNPNFNLPFIGITCLKLNNALLIGAGAILIELAELAIEQIIENYKTKNPKALIEFIMIESFGWHEITIVFFSNSYKTISDLLIRIRELDLGQVYNLLPEYCKLEECKKILKNQSLLGKKIASETSKEVTSAHVFVTSYTSFGYAFDLLVGSEKTLKNYPEVCEEELNKTLKLFSKWHTKPGHLEKSATLFGVVNEDNTVLKNSKSTEYQNINLLIGAGDYLLESAREKASHVFKINKSLTPENKAKNEEDQLRNHLRKINSIPQICYNQNELIEELKGEGYFRNMESHCFNNESLYQLSYSINDINDINTKLNEIHCSKVLREKILNMLSNFNDGITDPILYSFFIELKPFVNKIKQLITSDYPKEDGKTLKEIHDELDSLIEEFERAFKNRFHQSYRMNEITDFNMEHNGGIQQVISGLDAAYKSLCRVMGEETEQYSFVYLTGFSGVDSTKYNLRLNYFHVFQPSLYISAVVKEAFNPYSAKLPEVNSGNPTNELKKTLSDVILKSMLVTELSNKIEQNEEITNLSFLRYFRNIDAKMLDYFVADRVTFIVGYNYDEDLYSYWMWNTLTQMTIMYEKDGTFNEKLFCDIMIRMAFLHRQFDSASEQWVATDYWKSKNSTPPNIIFSPLWLKHYGAITKFIDFLLKQKSFSKILEHSNSVAETITERFFLKDDDNSALISTNINARFRKLRDNGFEIVRHISSPSKEQEMIEIDTKIVKFQNVSSPIQNELVHKYFITENHIKVARQQLSNGEIYAFNHGEKDVLNGYSNLYLIILFKAYLTLIKETNQAVDGGITSLLRDKHTKQILMKYDDQTLIKYVPLAFDPMGGIHTTNTEVRKEFFKRRSALIKSLYDFSLKKKIALFDLPQSGITKTTT